MKQSIQMCEGSLWKNIFFFGVPLMFAQILEVLFNLSRRNCRNCLFSVLFSENQEKNNRYEVRKLAIKREIR